jgi:hypothetical protein
MIYFLQETEPPYRIKIGYSANPTKRIATIAATLPQNVQILKIIEGSREDESFFHYIYKKYRVDGKREWYLPDTELLDIIDTPNIKAGNFN